MSRLALVSLVLALAAGCGLSPATARQPSGRCVECHDAHRTESGTCVTCHRGDPDAARQQLAHAGLISGRAAEHRLGRSAAVAEGDALVNGLACRRCHSIGGEGNALAASLDHCAWDRGQDRLTSAILAPADNMPRFGLTPAQAEAVVALLFNRADPLNPHPAYRVRFGHRAGSTFTPFDERCGGCHRALLPVGPEGRGSAGPNLSGLLTPYYPCNAKDGGAWEEAGLTDWLRNPRSLRVMTTMPPIELSNEERAAILGAMRDARQGS